MYTYKLLKFAATLLLCIASGHAATYTLGAGFATTMVGEPFNEPYVGTALFTYEAESPVAPGSYSWSSFTSPTVAISMEQHTFTEADLPGASSITIDIRENGFMFSGYGGAIGGAADFFQGGAHLTTQPLAPGGAETTAMYSYSPGGSNQSEYGTYGAAVVQVPEISSALLTFIGTGVFLFRRKR